MLQHKTQNKNDHYLRVKTSVYVFVEGDTNRFQQSHDCLEMIVFPSLISFIKVIVKLNYKKLLNCLKTLYLSYSSTD